MAPELTLIPIDRAGALAGRSGPLPVVAADAVSATLALYDSVGFELPWVGYLAFAGATPIGAAGFKSPPKDRRVEIAYFTFPEFEGRGRATQMARELVELALDRDPTLCVAARTLPERNASHRILEKLHFRHVATVEDAEDGTVWEWQLKSGRS